MRQVVQVPSRHARPGPPGTLWTTRQLVAWAKASRCLRNGQLSFGHCLNASQGWARPRRRRRGAPPGPPLGPGAATL
eukprot:1167546-Pyramimonas_sp.AAC.1